MRYMAVGTCFQGKHGRRGTLQTSCSPHDSDNQMNYEEQGEEEGKEDHIKHGPEVKKQISPATGTCPWLFPDRSKRAVPS